METLERIPEPLRIPEMQDLLEQVQLEKQESSELLTTIRERAKSRDLNGLPELVERALELLPQREDLQKIKGQLEARKREKKDIEAAQVYNNRGNAHRKNHDHDVAITDYTEAIRLNPEYALAYQYRGNAHAQLRDHGQAAADRQKARELQYEP